MWAVLDKARVMGANAKQMIAIREKIYAEQDSLISFIVENRIDNDKYIYGPRSRMLTSNIEKETSV